MYKFLFLFIFSLFISDIYSQDDEHIAMQFYRLRDYTKAEVLLKKQFDLSPDRFYEPLFKTYVQLRKYDEAIDITKKIIKLNSNKDIEHRYNLGYCYYKKNDSNAAKKEWLAANKLTTDFENHSLNILSQYLDLKQWAMAEDLIYNFQEKSKNQTAFSTYLIDVLIRQNKNEALVSYIIKLLENTSYNYMQVLSSLNILADKNDLLLDLEKKVYSKLNKDPKNEKWNEIAMWVSITAKDYEQALQLAKAIDKRMGDKSAQSLEIAEVAFSEKQYDVAIDGFEFLKSSPQNHLSRMGYERKLESMLAKYEKDKRIDTGYLRGIEKEFLAYFAKFEFSNSTEGIQLLYAQFYVRHIHNLETAHAILEKLLKTPNLSKNLSSRAKIDLADIKLAMNDIWEASLLYGQVDKEEKDSPLGEEARFKNSKVFYFNGDYELAEDLLSILKSSTTELIANDALYLALFIQENIDDPALKLAMKDISSAELLFYQNKDIEAFSLLQSVKKLYPKSSLIDDILLIEGNYALTHHNYKEAQVKYKELYTLYPTSVIADKALYEWAKIEEEINKNNPLAIDSYLLILSKYKDSVYSTDARKRMRLLRGDKLEEEL
jgi:hypothetical protein